MDRFNPFKEMDLGAEKTQSSLPKVADCSGKNALGFAHALRAIHSVTGALC
jgi:hypothetical protein